MTNVECLKALLSKMTGQDISTIKGETTCDLLIQIADAYQAGGSDGSSAPSVVPKALDVTFARKDIDGEGRFLMGEKETMDIDLILSDGTIIPANITFTDVEA